MNYETRLAHEPDMDFGHSAARRRKRFIVIAIIATVLVVAAIALALNFTRSGADDKAVVAETAKQIPLVTAIIPGRSSVDTVVHATGRSEEHTSELQSLMRI